MQRFFLRDSLSYNRELNKRLSLQRACIKNHLLAPPVVTLGFKLFSQERKVKDDRVLFSSSYVRNFYNWLVSQLSGAQSAITGKSYGDESLAIKTEDGVSRHHSFYCIHLFSWSDYVGEADFTHPGIAVGSGDAAFNFNDYNLSSLIESGSGSGQLDYLEPPSPIYTWDSGTRIFTVQHERTFKNNSSGNVTVKEVGIFPWINVSDFIYGYFMILRDLLPEPVTVPPNETLTLTYSLFITYPS